MIKCPNCGSTDVCFEYSFDVWQNAEGEFELAEDQIDWVCFERYNLDDRFMCNDCGKLFTPSHYTGKKIYKLFVSKLCYGSATVQADSEKDVKNKIFEGLVNVEYHDSEITDVTAE